MSNFLSKTIYINLLYVMIVSSKREKSSFLIKYMKTGDDDADSYMR